MQNITLVAKRKGGTWVGAVAVDNDFQDVVTGLLTDLIEDNVLVAVEAIAADLAEGTRVQITVNVVPAK